MNRMIVDGLSVDVIVTSPPYNINKKYQTYKDRRERKDYLSWFSDIAKTSYKILENDGSFFLNVSGTPSDSLLLQTDLQSTLHE
jgi:site-specific DNA-methyltransferase (adenine-specific)